MLTVLKPLLSLCLGTIIWHIADVRMLASFEAGKPREGVLWVLLHVASVPFFAYSSVMFFRINRSWWIVEFPYFLLGLLVSAFLFRTTLQVQISWREGLAGVLVLVIMWLVSGK